MYLDASKYRHSFIDAKPFPHIVIDGLWAPNRLESIAAEFPSKEDDRWQTYGSEKERGKRAGASNMWGTETRAWFREMRSRDTQRAFEALTDIYPLTADDLGGGMHMTCEGGHLDMHADFNLHPDNQELERRLNVLVFLNHDWEEEWGGTLYLGENRESWVIPEFNRTVIFACSATSWHGHPEPIIGEHSRKSLACYYYAPRRPETKEGHSTVWG